MGQLHLTAMEAMKFMASKDSFPRFDPGNITGKKLAEIGRWTLEGHKILEQQMKEESYSFNRPEADYTDVGWLDMRVDEICQKGRL